MTRVFKYRRRYFFLRGREGELMPFQTLNGWVQPECLEQLPLEVQPLCRTYPIASLKQEVRRIGYDIVRNAWVAKKGIQFTRKGDGWAATCCAMHMATGQQKTVAIESPSEHKQDAISLFFECWTNAIRMEFEAYDLHTHLEHDVNGVLYPEG